MRIQIKTTNPIKDGDVKALFIIGYALSLCKERMIIPTLQFFADRYGYRVVPKP